MADFSQYPGLLENFPRGTTVPIKFEMKDPDGVIVDVTGGKVFLAFSTSYPGTATPTLEVEIDPGDPTLGEFEGEITGTQSLTLTAGSIYYEFKFIDVNDKPYVFDMQKIKILNEVSDRIAQ